VGTRSVVVGSVANLKSLALPPERLLLTIPYRSTYHPLVTLTFALAVTPIVGRPSPCDPHCRLLFHCCDDALHTLCASTALASLFLRPRCYLQLSMLRLHCSCLFRRLSPASLLLRFRYATKGPIYIGLQRLPHAGLGWWRGMESLLCH
jgi:hypothetical protein